MDSYLDTSFLLKFYLIEPDSSEAEECLRKNPGTRWISSLSDVEVVASISRSRNLSPAVAAREISNYRDDLRLGAYRKLQLDAKVYSRAEEIAESYSRSYGLRSLDLLHLATSLRHGVAAIGTFDKRLADAARVLGLKVLPERS